MMNEVLIYSQNKFFAMYNEIRRVYKQKNVFLSSYEDYASSQS